jgi:hypothetical protein
MKDHFRLEMAINFDSPAVSPSRADECPVLVDIIAGKPPRRGRGPSTQGGGPTLPRTSRRGGCCSDETTPTSLGHDQVPKAANLYQIIDLESNLDYEILAI